MKTDIEETSLAVVCHATKLGLKVNEQKAKYMAVTKNEFKNN